MKKILIIVPNLRLGGQERIAVQTAALLKKEYEVTLVLFDNKEAAYFFEGEIVNLNIPAKPHIFSKVINIIKRSYRLRRLKINQSIDYSISFGESANIVNILSGKIGRRILSIHGYADLKNRSMDRFLYKRGEQILCCSKEIKKKYEEFFPDFRNAVVLYNPYNVSKMLSLGKEEVFDYSFSGKTIVTHGRLEEVKNYPRLIRAFSLVRKQRKDVRLLIIGEGNMRKELEKLVSDFEISDLVSFLGFRKNPFSYLSKSDLYVLSSYHEGFPNALAEGMVFMPVISVDAKSGPKEMLADLLELEISDVEEARFGILVNQEKERASSKEKKETDRSLADAILRLLEDKEKYERYKKLASERVHSFSEERYKERLIELLKE